MRRKETKIAQSMIHSVSKAARREVGERQSAYQWCLHTNGLNADLQATQHGLALSFIHFRGFRTSGRSSSMPCGGAHNSLLHGKSLVCFLGWSMGRTHVKSCH